MLEFNDVMAARMRRFVHEAFGVPEPSACAPLAGGLINDTFRVDGMYVLQRVNPIFGASVNSDIASLVPVLSRGGVCVPSLLRAMTGAWCAEGGDFGFEPGNWRLMQLLPGESRQSAGNMSQIRSLTRALARFHGALDGCCHVFAHSRPGVHDIERHAEAFGRAVAERREHRLYREVSELHARAVSLLRHIDFESVMDCPAQRIIHGDPKITNFLFSGDEVCGVVDLDTMARSRVSFDVGDAVRSWCNPKREDEEPSYDREYAREVVGLYEEEAKFLSAPERRSLKSSAPFITLELCMRFGRDALCEDYFGYDASIGHGEHSLRRAEAMYALVCQMLEGREV